jgi:large subunit ribosomal protein L23
MKHLSDVIVKPLLTEKSSRLTDERSTYCFEVKKLSNKNEIKLAIEKYFDVKVTKVRTLVNPGKVKRTAKGVKKTAGFKKAYVQVADGQKIELFKGI